MKNIKLTLRCFIMLLVAMTLFSCEKFDDNGLYDNDYKLVENNPELDSYFRFTTDENCVSFDMKINENGYETGMTNKTAYTYTITGEKVELLWENDDLMEKMTIDILEDYCTLQYTIGDTLTLTYNKVD